MLLWLEEAAVEAAMILAVTAGTVLFILATWSLLADWLGRETSADADKETTSSSGRSAVVTTLMAARLDRRELTAAPRKSPLPPKEG